MMRRWLAYTCYFSLFLQAEAATVTVSNSLSLQQALESSAYSVVFLPASITSTMTDVHVNHNVDLVGIPDPITGALPIIQPIPTGGNWVGIPIRARAHFSVTSVRFRTTVSGQPLLSASDSTSSIVVRNCTFEGSDISGSAGSQAEVWHSTFVGNPTTGMGGVQFTLPSKLNIYHCTFGIGSFAVIYGTVGVTSRFEGCRFLGDFRQAGGGEVQLSLQGGSFVVRDCLFRSVTTRDTPPVTAITATTCSLTLHTTTFVLPQPPAAERQPDDAPSYVAQPPLQPRQAYKFLPSSAANKLQVVNCVFRGSGTTATVGALAGTAYPLLLRHPSFVWCNSSATACPNGWSCSLASPVPARAFHGITCVARGVPQITAVAAPACAGNSQAGTAAPALLSRCPLSPFALRVTGYNLLPHGSSTPAAVSVGPLPCTGVALLSAPTASPLVLACTTPHITGGPWPVVASLPGGLSSASRVDATQLQPSVAAVVTNVTSISPSSSPSINGGVPVMITGAGFGLVQPPLGSCRLTIAGTPCVPLLWLSNTRLRCTVGEGVGARVPPIYTCVGSQPSVVAAATAAAVANATFSFPRANVTAASVSASGGLLTLLATNLGSRSRSAPLVFTRPAKGGALQPCASSAWLNSTALTCLHSDTGVPHTCGPVEVVVRVGNQLSAAARLCYGAFAILSSCPAGTRLSGDRTACELCPVDTYFPTANPSDTCLPCPLGASCSMQQPDDGGASGVPLPFALPGYWRSDPQSSDFAASPLYPCPMKDGCLGGPESSCAPGYKRGVVLCGVCEVGYVKRAGRCTACSGTIASNATTTADAGGNSSSSSINSAVTGLTLREAVARLYAHEIPLFCATSPPDTRTFCPTSPPPTSPYPTSSPCYFPTSILCDFGLPCIRRSDGDPSSFPATDVCRDIVTWRAIVLAMGRSDNFTSALNTIALEHCDAQCLLGSSLSAGAVLGRRALLFILVLLVALAVLLLKMRSAATATAAAAAAAAATAASDAVTADSEALSVSKQSNGGDITGNLAVENQPRDGPLPAAPSASSTTASAAAVGAADDESGGEADSAESNGIQEGDHTEEKEGGEQQEQEDEIGGEEDAQGNNGEGEKKECAEMGCDEKESEETADERSVLAKASEKVQAHAKAKATARAQAVVDTAKAEVMAALDTQSVGSVGVIPVPSSDQQPTSGGGSGIVGVVGSLGTNLAGRRSELEAMVAARKGEAFGRLKLLIGYLQVLTHFNLTFSALPWPPAFLALLDAARVVNLDVMQSAAAASCALFRSTFYTKFTLHMLLLPAALALVCAAHAILARCCCCCGSRHRGGDGAAARRDAVAATRNQLLVLAVTTLYPGLCSRIFRVFHCTKVDSRWYLQADLTQQCFSGAWVGYGVAAGLLMMAYALGIPVAVIWLLRRHRASLASAATQAQYGALYISYAPSFWYWEGVEMVRKLILTGGLVLLAASGVAQVLLGVLVCLFYVLALGWLKPLNGNQSNQLALLASLQLLLTLVMGVALRADALLQQVQPNAANAYDKVGMAVLLVASNATVFALGLLSTLLASSDTVRARLQQATALLLRRCTCCLRRPLYSPAPKEETLEAPCGGEVGRIQCQ